VTAFLALAAALILAGVATFGYFGGYWWQYWQQIRETVDAPDRPHWMDADDE
jgi:multidrug resistance efflux pump